MKLKVSFKNAFIAGLAAAAISAAVNTLLFLAFHAAGVINDTIEMQPGQPMSLMPVIFSSILPSLLGSVVFWLFERFSGKGFRNFSILSIVLLVLSFSNPFLAIPGVTIGYGLALCLLHVVVTTSLLLMIRSKVRNTK